MGVVTTAPVKAGEELFTYYGYGRVAMPEDFPWYWDMKKQIEDAENLEAQNSKNNSDPKDVSPQYYSFFMCNKLLKTRNIVT